ncbi:MAG: hypothetical protein ACKPCM_18050 [Pseudanabaena sp.]
MDDTLVAQGLSRHIKLYYSSFLVAPSIIARTDLITTLAERVAIAFAKDLNLKIFPCSLEIEGFAVVMRWHQSTTNQSAHKWLRQLFSDIATSI